jgi:putative ABC transport system permease protein
MLISLILGIGANIAVFSVVKATLLQPLPFKDPDRLMIIWESSSQSSLLTVSYPNYLDWQSQNHFFESMAAIKLVDFNLTGLEKPAHAVGSMVSTTFFDLLGVSPAFGRNFTKEDGEGSGREVAIVSYGFWQRHFNADPHVLGRSLRVDGKTFTLIGVAPQEFEFGTAELWVPIQVYARPLMTRDYRQDVWALARLKPNATIAEARAEMDTIEQRLSRIYPAANSGVSINIIPLKEEGTRLVKPTLLVLFGAVVFILAIGCLNVSNLVVAQVIARWRDVATRLALGATPAKLMSLFVTESLVLSLIGGAGGVVAAYWCIRVLLATNLERIYRLNQARLDPVVLLFGFAVSILSGLVCAAFPMAYARHIDLHVLITGRTSALNEEKSLRFLRKLLVVSAIALAVVLTVGAISLVKSFLQIQSNRPGFQSQDLTTARISLPESRYSNNEKIMNFYNALLERVRNLPRVRSAAVVGFVALSRYHAWTAFEVEGSSPNQQLPHTDFLPVSADYFRAFGVPILRGRGFTAADTSETDPVIIVDEVAAREYWPGADPLGKRIRIRLTTEATGQWRVIVGIVGHVRHFSLDLDDTSGPEMYVPYKQAVWPSMALIVQTIPGAFLAPQELQQTVQSLDPELAVYNVETMDDAILRSLSRRRVATQTLGLLGLVALTLATLGVYGATSHLVNERVPEIGVRMALGAQKFQILSLIMAEGFRMAALGVGIGIVLALFLEQLLASWLLGFMKLDIPSFAEVTILMIIASLAGCYGPAARASAVQPLDCIREQ